MKVASVWAWLLVVIRFYFNEMPKISSGFQPSKCSSTLWRLNGCHRPTSTGTGLCISWCWENCDMLILTRFGLTHLSAPGKAKQTPTATDLKMMVHVPTLSWELSGWCTRIASDDMGILMGKTTKTHLSCWSNPFGDAGNRLWPGEPESGHCPGEVSASEKCRKKSSKDAAICLHPDAILVLRSGAQRSPLPHPGVGAEFMIGLKGVSSGCFRMM